MILFFVNFIILCAVAIVSIAVNSLSVEDLRKEKSINRAVNIEIKVFGENGMEWTVRGKSINIEEPVVYFGKPVLKLDGYTIKAQFAEVDRINKVGYMKGNILIEGKDLKAVTEELHIDMKKNILEGEGIITIRRKNTTIRGKGFVMYLKPFKAIIKEADALHSN